VPTTRRPRLFSFGFPRTSLERNPKDPWNAWRIGIAIVRDDSSMLRGQWSTVIKSDDRRTNRSAAGWIEERSGSPRRSNDRISIGSRYVSRLRALDPLKVSLSLTSVPNGDGCSPSRPRPAERTNRRRADRRRRRHRRALTRGNINACNVTRMCRTRGERGR